MKMVLTPDSSLRKTYRETGANQRDTKQRNRMGGETARVIPAARNNTCEVIITYVA